jgi:hypothetical protein
VIFVFESGRSESRKESDAGHLRPLKHGNTANWYRSSCGRTVELNKDSEKVSAVLSDKPAEFFPYIISF